MNFSVFFRQMLYFWMLTNIIPCMSIFHTIFLHFFFSKKGHSLTTLGHEDKKTQQQSLKPNLIFHRQDLHNLTSAIFIPFVILVG